MFMNLLIATALLLLAAQSAQAQDEPIHPLLKNRFTLTGGAFIPEKEFEFRINGIDRGDNIDFDDAFKIKKTESTGALDFRWRFGEKWSVFGQYWSVSDTGKATLEEDLEWRDVVFQEGTFAEGNVGIDVARVIFGRLFSTSPRHELGLGAGLHWLELSAGISGQILTNVGDTELYGDSVAAGAPLPNIAGWYTYAFSPQWALTSRLDWFSASFDEYSGSLWNAGVGVEWSIFQNFGIGASYNFFELDVDVKNDNWKGSAKITQHGPFLSVTATW